MTHVRVALSPHFGMGARRGGEGPEGRKGKATLHWVSAGHAVNGEVRLYDRLFTAESPESAAEKSGQTFLDLLNPASLEVRAGCKLEPMLGTAPAGTRGRKGDRPRPA